MAGREGGRPVRFAVRMSEAKFQCGGSEVRIICAATSSCGLLNQSHTRINNLPVSFDSEVRKGRRRERMRTSESGHWPNRRVSAAIGKKYSGISSCLSRGMARLPRSGQS